MTTVTMDTDRDDTSSAGSIVVHAADGSADDGTSASASPMADDGSTGAAGDVEHDVAAVLPDLVNSFSSGGYSPMKKELHPLETLPQVTEAIRDNLERGWKEGEVAVKFQFIGISIPSYVTSLLARNDLGDSIYRQALIPFCQALFDLMIATREDNVSTLVTSASRLLKPSSFFHWSQHSSNGQAGSGMYGQDNLPSIDTVNAHYVIEKNYIVLLVVSLLKNTCERTLTDMASVATFVSTCLHLMKPEKAETFARKIYEFLFQHIDKLTDEELRNEERHSIAAVLQAIRPCVELCLPDTYQEVLMQFTLKTGLRCFRSPYLDWRIAGLSAIKEIIAQVDGSGQQRSTYNQAGRAPTPVLQVGTESTRYMADWLVQNEILTTLFGDNLHIELLRRSGPVLKFLGREGRLGPGELDFIWDTTHDKHETVIRQVYEVIPSLLDALPVESIDYLYDKVKRIPPSTFDLKTLTLVQAFSIAASGVTHTHPERQFYGCDILWGLQQDDSGLEVTLYGNVNDILNDLLAWQVYFPVHGHYVQAAIANIAAHRGVFYSQRVLKQILSAYPVETEPGVQAARALIDSSEHVNEGTSSLTDILVSDLVYYMNQAKTHPARANFSDDLVHAIYDNVSTHEHAVNQRCELIRFVTTTRLAPVLDHTQVDQLWRALVLETATTAETELGFAQLDLLVRHALPEDLVRHLFDDQVCNLHVDTLTVPAYSFVLNLWKALNIQAGKLQVIDTKDTVVVSSFEDGLHGVDLLFRIAQSVEDAQVGSDVVRFLAALYTTAAPSAQAQIGPQRAMFITRCLQSLSHGGREIHKVTSSKDIAASERVIFRMLAILKTLLDNFDAMTKANSKSQFRRHGQGAMGAPVDIVVTVVMQPAPAPLQLGMYERQTLWDLKSEVGRQLKVDARVVRLIAFGRELQGSDCTLADAKIVDGTKIHATIRQAPDDNNTWSSQAETAGGDNGNSSTVGDDAQARAAQYYPATILAKPELFELLFDLLSLGRRIGQEIWDVLMMLPTNSAVLNQFELLCGDADLSDSERDWEALLDTRSTFKLYYALQVVEHMRQGDGGDALGFPFQCEGCSNTQVLHGKFQVGQQVISTHFPPESCSEFNRAFVRHGGVRHLVKVLLDGDVWLENRGSQRLNCLVLLLKTIRFYAGFPTEIREGESGPTAFPLHPRAVRETLTLDGNLAPVVQHLCRIVDDICVPGAYLQAKKAAGQSMSSSTTSLAGPTPHPGTDDAHVPAEIFALMSTCIAAHPIAAKEVYELFSGPGWLSRILLETENEAVRTAVSRGLTSICQLPDHAFREAKLEPPVVYTIYALLALVDEARKFETHCAEYFALLHYLCSHAATIPGNKLLSGLGKDVERLAEKVISREIVESHLDPDSPDVFLCGLLGVLQVLLAANPGLKSELVCANDYAFLSHIFWNCLFDQPSMQDHGVLSPPKCKTKRSRSMAFKLLAELTSGIPEGWTRVVRWMTEKQLLARYRTSWYHRPAGDERSSTGYGGLVNLGATCYMNSLMQQIYNIPQFRHELLSLRDESADLTDSLLFQLQKIFAYLQESVRRAYNTREFCLAYKDWDGQSMNPSVQMDVDEFFNMFFDKLENLLKGTRQQYLLQRFFGGSIMNQLISKPCGHRRERKEDVYVVQLDVKNHRDLSESLSYYIEGDVLDGDNQFFCEECDQKRDTLKRVCLHQLPNTMILHLKRFEFDFDRMCKMKVNDYFAFPMEIDFSPYTVEGLARKEAAREQEENQDGDKDGDGDRDGDGTMREVPEMKEAAYYQFELTGILVHSGTADSGHYFSYIKERHPAQPGKPRRWCQFNDSSVDYIDENDIPQWCFGGTESIQQWDNVTQKMVNRWHPKPTSAYMLIFDRKEPIPVSLPENVDNKEQFSTVSLADPVLTDKEAGAVVQPEMFEAIWKDNVQFFNETMVFDSEYSEFVWQAVQNVASLHTANSPAPASLVTASIELATKYVINILARAQDKNSLVNWIQHVKTMLSSSPDGQEWFLRELLKPDCPWLEDLMFDNNVPESREAFAGLILHVLKLYRVNDKDNYFIKDLPVMSPMAVSEEGDTEQGSTFPDDGPQVGDKQKAQTIDTDIDVELPTCLQPLSYIPRSLVIQVLERMLSMLERAPAHWRTFSEYFGLMIGIARLGQEEKAYMLDRGVVTVLIDFFLGDESPYTRSRAGGHKRKKMGDNFAAPNMGNLITLIVELVDACAILDVDAKSNQERLAKSPGMAIDLTMGGSDVELVTGTHFLHRVILRHSSSSAAQLCRHLCVSTQAEVSSKLIQSLVEATSDCDDSEISQYLSPLHLMLGVADKHQEDRVALTCRLLFPLVNESMAQRAASEAYVRFLLRLVEENNCACAHLHHIRENWYSYLITCPYPSIRSLYELLIQSFVPEACELPTVTSYPPTSPSPNDPKADGASDFSFATHTRPLPPSNADVVLSEEDAATLRDIYDSLRHLFPVASTYVDGRVMQDDPQASPRYNFHLVSYLRLLQWCIRTTEDKEMFTALMEQYLDFVTHLDSLHIELDDNKLYAVTLWLHVSRDCDANIDVFVQNESYCTKAMDFFLSLRPDDRFNMYNARALHPFYQIIDVATARSEGFLELVREHRNWKWAIRYLFLENTSFPQAAEAIYRVLERCCRFPDFRAQGLRQLLMEVADNVNRLIIYHHWTIQYLNLLLHGEEEYTQLVVEKGFLTLTGYLNDTMAAAHAQPQLLASIDVALSILDKVTSWLGLRAAEPSADVSPEMVAQVMYQASHTMFSFLFAVIHSTACGVNVNHRALALLQSLISFQDTGLDDVMALFDNHYLDPILGALDPALVGARVGGGNGRAGNGTGVSATASGSGSSSVVVEEESTVPGADVVPDTVPDAGDGMDVEDNTLGGNNRGRSTAPSIPQFTIRQIAGQTLRSLSMSHWSRPSPHGKEGKNLGMTEEYDAAILDLCQLGIDRGERDPEDPVFLSAQHLLVVTVMDNMCNHAPVRLTASSTAVDGDTVCHPCAVLEYFQQAVFPGTGGASNPRLARARALAPLVLVSALTSKTAHVWNCPRCYPLLEAMYQHEDADCSLSSAQVLDCASMYPGQCEKLVNFLHVIMDEAENGGDSRHPPIERVLEKMSQLFKIVTLLCHRADICAAIVASSLPEILRQVRQAMVDPRIPGDCHALVQVVRGSLECMAQLTESSAQATASVVPDVA